MHHASTHHAMDRELSDYDGQEYDDLGYDGLDLGYDGSIPSAPVVTTTPAARKVQNQLADFFSRFLFPSTGAGLSTSVAPPHSKFIRDDEVKFSAQDFAELVSGKSLGAGAFGTTKVVSDKKGKSTYVLKTMPKSKVTEEDFINEVNVLKQVQHGCGPHLLCYTSQFEDATNYYILTDFLGGYVPLDAYIKNTPDNERWKNIEAIYLNLILGLKDLHESGVAHRDIKPSNILIDPVTKHIKYIDFGLSCIAAECPAAPIGGTPDYMAPEIYFDLKVDEYKVPLNFATYQLGDIWSLAITMIEYILGEQSFEDAIVKATVQYPGATDKGKINWMAFIPTRFTRKHPGIVRNIGQMLNVDYAHRAFPKTYTL
jgi:serine/threonine protein kinase